MSQSGLACWMSSWPELAACEAAPLETYRKIEGRRKPKENRERERERKRFHRKRMKAEREKVFSESEKSNVLTNCSRRKSWKTEVQFKKNTHMLHFSSWETFLCNSWLWALQAAMLEGKMNGNSMTDHFEKKKIQKNSVYLNLVKFSNITLRFGDIFLS